MGRAQWLKHVSCCLTTKSGSRFDNYAAGRCRGDAGANHVHRVRRLRSCNSPPSTWTSPHHVQQHLITLAYRAGIRLLFTMATAMLRNASAQAAAVARGYSCRRCVMLAFLLQGILLSLSFVCQGHVLGAVQVCNKCTALALVGALRGSCCKNLCNS